MNFGRNFFFVLFDISDGPQTRQADSVPLDNAAAGLLGKVDTKLALSIDQSQMWEMLQIVDEESNVMSIDFCENDCPGSKCIILIFLIDLFNRMCTHQTNIKRNGKITDFDATWAG